MVGTGWRKRQEMNIRKHLYLVSGGVYGKLGNVYVITHHDGYVMIDCGSYHALDTIKTNLAYWNIDETKITHVLMTHGHDDHAGCAAYYQEIGAKIVVGKEDSIYLKRGNFGVESPYLNHSQPPCIPDIELSEDTLLTISNLEIQVYTMPGHTNGSLLYMLFLDGEQIIFTGDMFYADGEKGDLAFTGWKGDMKYSPTILGESFKKLWALQLSPFIVAGGHGTPIIGSHAKDSIMIAYKYYMLNNR